MCGRKCRRNSICSLSLFSTLGEHLKRIIVLNLHNFLNSSAPDYFFSGFHSRLFFSGFNCSPKNVCTCLPQNLSSAKKNSMRRKKLMKKWILVQNWRSPLGASLASCSRLFVHFGQKEFSPALYLHFYILYTLTRRKFFLHKICIYISVHAALSLEWVMN